MYTYHKKHLYILLVYIAPARYYCIWELAICCVCILLELYSLFTFCACKWLPVSIKFFTWEFDARVCVRVRHRNLRVAYTDVKNDCALSIVHCQRGRKATSLACCNVNLERCFFGLYSLTLWIYSVTSWEWRSVGIQCACIDNECYHRCRRVA